VTTIALIRHGQTEWNSLGRIQGSSDIPLNDIGREQARETGRRLSSRHWDAVLSSPLARAHETAAIIAAELGIASVVTLEGIAERSYGQAEGLTGPEIRERYHGDLESVPGLESRADVIARALPAITGLAVEYPNRALVVVSHGAVIGSLVRALTTDALPAKGQQIHNGSDHHLRIEDGMLILEEFAGEDYSAMNFVI
jgi:uncharacterized phosphatase